MSVLMIKVVSALFLLLGSGLIFRALVAMDAPSFQPRFVVRRRVQRPNAAEEPASLRRAA